MKKQQPEYEFVPYKFGCYSYSAKADISVMVKKGYLKEEENKYCKLNCDTYSKNLKPHDQKKLGEVIADYGNMSGSALIKHTYLNFPFFAIRSIIAQEVLSGELYEHIKNAMPKGESTALFTIGYEGISLEKYLQKLIINNVKLLVDVRKNP